MTAPTSSWASSTGTVDDARTGSADSTLHGRVPAEAETG